MTTFRILSISIALACCASAVGAAPSIGASRSGSAVSTTGLFAAADLPAVVPRPLPLGWEATSAIRVVFRERLGLPEGYSAATRLHRLVDRFALHETGMPALPGGAAMPFARRPATAAPWPPRPEFVNRRAPLLFAENPAEARMRFGPALRLDAADTRETGERVWRAALGPATTDAPRPMPRAIPPLDPVRLMAAHSAPRGAPGYLRAAMPAAGRQISYLLPHIPAVPAPDDRRSFLFDVATENVLRVFNNPATTLGAFLAGLFETEEPAVTAPADRLGAPLAAATLPPVPPGIPLPDGGGTPVIADNPPPAPVPLPAGLAALALALGALAAARARLGAMPRA